VQINRKNKIDANTHGYYCIESLFGVCFVNLQVIGGVLHSVRHCGGGTLCKYIHGILSYYRGNCSVLQRLYDRGRRCRCYNSHTTATYDDKRGPINILCSNHVAIDNTVCNVVC